MINLRPLLTTLLLGPLAGLALAQPATVIDLELRGGPHAGSYHAESDDPTCSYGLAFGEDAWGNQYSIDTEDAAAFSSLQLVVPSTAEAAAGTGTFRTTVTFGPYFTGDSYTVDTTQDPAEGSGTVTVADEGDRAKVTITGSTPEGVEIEAEITCNAVIRASGGEGAASEEAPQALPVSLTIGGERYAFDASDESAGCEEGMAEEGDLYYSFYDDSGAAGVSDLELLIYDAATAAGGSSQFYFQADGQRVYLDTTADDGAGTATVRREGERLVLTLDATAADGTAVQATLTCLAP